MGASTERLEALNALAAQGKPLVSKRLGKPPAAAASDWLVRYRLSPVEMSVASTVRRWTVDRGSQWTPLASIAMTQFVENLPPKRGGGADRTAGRGDRMTVDRAIKGLCARGVIDRVPGTHGRGVSHAGWYWLGLIPEALNGPNRFNGEGQLAEAGFEVEDPDRGEVEVWLEDLAAIKAGKTQRTGPLNAAIPPGKTQRTDAEKRSERAPGNAAISQHGRTSPLVAQGCVAQESVVSAARAADHSRPLNRADQDQDDEAGWCGRHSRDRICDLCRKLPVPA